jgi:hypothetical protein
MTPPEFFPVLHDCKTACLPAGGRENFSAAGSSSSVWVYEEIFLVEPPAIYDTNQF